jgi:hypothetical protein
MSSITSNLYTNNLQSLLNINVNTSTDSTSGTSQTSSVSSSDSSQLSPFGLATAALTNLQQTDPAKYQVVTGQIASNLQTAGQDAAADGYPVTADVFKKLSSDFATASSTGALPTFPDLAKLAGVHAGAHHHIHGAPKAPTTPVDSDSSSSTDTTSTTSSTSNSATQAANQLLASLQASQTSSLSPTNVILNTLDSAGISV